MSAGAQTQKRRITPAYSSSVSRVAPVSVLTFTHWPIRCSRRSKFSRVHPTRNDHIPTLNTRKNGCDGGHEPPVGRIGDPADAEREIGPDPLRRVTPELQGRNSEPQIAQRMRMGRMNPDEELRNTRNTRKEVGGNGYASPVGGTGDPAEAERETGPDPLRRTAPELQGRNSEPQIAQRTRMGRMNPDEELRNTRTTRKGRAWILNCGRRCSVVPAIFAGSGNRKRNELRNTLNTRKI